MLKTLQQAILLNPKDMRAKVDVGMSWYRSRDAGEKKQGQDLLEEVAASSDATYATKAKNWLADFKSGRLTLEPDHLGNLEIVTHGQPASIQRTPILPHRQAAKLAAWAAKINRGYQHRKPVLNRWRNFLLCLKAVDLMASRRSNFGNGSF